MLEHIRQRRKGIECNIHLKEVMGFLYNTEIPQKGDARDLRVVARGLPYTSLLWGAATESYSLIFFPKEGEWHSLEFLKVHLHRTEGYRKCAVLLQCLPTLQPGERRR